MTSRSKVTWVKVKGHVGQGQIRVPKKNLSYCILQPRMDQYFQQMDKIIKQKKTSSRVRFMLQDVIELRHVREILFSITFSLLNQNIVI